MATVSPWVASRRKRALDLMVSVPVSVLSAPFVVLLVAAAMIDTRKPGLFRQQRVGRNGELFTVLKVRSMRPGPNTSTVTVRGDDRITRLGSILRAYKLDELPQFWNVARGTMSLVGPRPDVPGYADTLQGDDVLVLQLRPGITGPATLFFRGEEELLAAQNDPMSYNDQVVWPKKVSLNLAYAKHGTFADDLRLVLMTLKPDAKMLNEILARWPSA